MSAKRTGRTNTGSASTARTKDTGRAAGAKSRTSTPRTTPPAPGAAGTTTSARGATGFSAVLKDVLGSVPEAEREGFVLGVVGDEGEGLDAGLWGRGPSPAERRHAALENLRRQYRARRAVVAESLTRSEAAELLEVSAGDILVCSTGLIGTGGEEFRAKVLDGVARGVAALSAEGGGDAAAAIMTTDTVAKTAVISREGWTIGGMAKGAGMLAPGLATMLVVITTDADLEASQADAALRRATGVSFDRLDSDGCMSTNDQVTLLANAASGVRPDLDDFAAALTELCRDLAAQLQADAEGASHSIAIEVKNAVNETEAVEVGRSVARNNLFKAAIFGNDPNWGRVLAAIGTTSAQFDPYDVDVSMNGVRVCTAGGPDRPREEVDLTPRDTHIEIDLKIGDATATILTNDLTHDYVHENSAYAS